MVAVCRSWLHMEVGCITDILEILLLKIGDCKYHLSLTSVYRIRIV